VLPPTIELPASSVAFTDVVDGKLAEMEVSCGCVHCGGRKPFPRKAPNTGALFRTFTRNPLIFDKLIDLMADYEYFEIALARKLAAAVISSRMGLKSVDSTMKKLGHEPIGEYWLQLARTLSMANIGDFEGILPSDKPKNQ
jgi:hypothetical protein